MAKQINIAELIAKVNAYFVSVYNKLHEKPEVVESAAETAKLGGSTLASLVIEADGYSKAHIDNHSDPHTLTPTQVGSYSNEEFQTQLALKVSSGVIPISRYGTLSYLPPGVSGSFEGATTVKTSGAGGPGSREAYTMQLEDNGTLVFLRNGTDGSTLGVYYGYMLDAAQGINVNKVKLTTTRYNPPFIPAGSSVQYVYQGGTGVVAGRIQDNATGAASRCFLALMNGTLDGVAHDEVWLDPAVWDTILNRAEVILGPDKVYILFQQYAEQTSLTQVPIEYILYEIPLTAFGSGQQTVPTKVNIGECTGFAGVKYTTGNIQLAAIAETNKADVPAMIWHVNATVNNTFFGGQRMMVGSGRIMTQSAFNPDGTKLRMSAYHDGRWTGTSGAGMKSVKLNYSWVLDLKTMKVTLDEGIDKLTITENDTRSVLTYGGTICHPNNGWTIMNYIGADISPRTYLTTSGLIFCSRMGYASQSFEGLYRGKWNNFTTIFDAIKAPMGEYMPETRGAITVPTTYGSAAGDSFDSFRLLPDNQCVVMCRSELGGSNGVTRIGLAPKGAALDFSYKYKTTAGDGTLLNGLKPTTDREVLTTAADRIKFIGYLQEMDDIALRYTSGAVLSNVTGFQTRWLTINPDLTTNGVVSITLQKINVLRDAIMEREGILMAGQTSTPYIELVLPQNPAMIAYAIVSVFAGDADGRTILSVVDASSRSGEIGSVTMGPAILTTRMSGGKFPAQIGGDSFQQFRQAAHAIYETTDSFIVVGASMGHFNSQSNSVAARYRFLVNKADKSVERPFLVGSTVSLPGERWIGLPGIGIGAASSLDYATKLVFGKIARTKAEYVTWAAPPAADWKVLVAQEVAQGWLVYFTEDTPVIINGVVGVLKAGNINLASIKANPANSTFYIYVQMNGGFASYAIRPTFETETDTFMFIGTAVTNDSGISTLTVEKVTKFAGFRLSATPAGSSIPVTPGLPSRESHIHPGWK